MLNLDKKLVTEDGQPVTLISKEGRGDFKLIGYIGDTLILRTWTIEGRYSDGYHSLNNLINAPEWQLPAPPDGKEWLNARLFKEGMLEEGERPLLVGEPAKNGDLFYSIVLDRWLGAGGCIDNTYAYKTKRPLPSEPEMVELDDSDAEWLVGCQVKIQNGRISLIVDADSSEVYIGQGYVFTYKQLRNLCLIRKPGTIEWIKPEKIKK